MIIPVERFLSRRLWLGQLLHDHECEPRLDDALQAILGRSTSERREVRSVLEEGIRPIDTDQIEGLLRRAGFQRELKTFQRRDLAHILAISHGANFSVPGAGKTTVAYALYAAERARGKVERLLVVAPLSAFGTWFTEAIACLEHAPIVARLERTVPKCEVLLTNYQRLASRYEDIAAWVMERPCHVILDEAHRMKRGRQGEWGSACLDLSHLAIRRDILTGTPAPQHPTDFIALLDFLWPHQATQILPRAVQRTDPPPEMMTEISQRLHPLFARTRKDELGLDPPTLRVELVEMKPLQAEIYSTLRLRMRKATAASHDHATLARMGRVVAYLLEAATNPALLASALGSSAAAHVAWPPRPLARGSSLAEKVINYGSHEVPRKFEKLATMVAANAAAGRKTLVWSNFVGNLKELSGRILMPYQPALIYGAVPSGDEDADYVTRERELRRFRSDPNCQVLLANPAAMSEGVSLHEECHDAIYVERTFNAGQYLQSIDRIHRLGLKAGIETRITFLVSVGTVDEVVDSRVRVKAERLAAMLSDPNLVTMALPDEDSYGDWIDPDDLDGLFAHLSDG
ncbi:MAG: DEAD/DEAH box helicase [Actinomycetota bacterium]|nr:DEAD/DEAH box helicase [Actinomycetota bacterium]